MIDGTYRPPHEEIQRICKQIGYEILGSGMAVVNLVAVTRGGLIPAGYLSRTVRWSQTDTIDLSSYRPDGAGKETPSKMSVTKNPKLHNSKGFGALFIDDVLDSGGTASYLRRTYPESKITVVYSKMSPEESTEYVDFVGEYIDDVWINFPWEQEQR